MDEAEVEAKSRILARLVREASEWTYDAPPGPDEPLRGRAIWHGFQSALEGPMLLLSALGAVADERGICRFVIDRSEVEPFARQAIEAGADFSAVLTAFIGFFAGHRRTLSSGRTPFDVPAHLRAETGALVRLGYAEERGDRFVWTDRMGPLMRQLYLWDPDDAALDERRREEMEDLLLAMSPATRAEVIACCKSRNMPRIAEIVAEQMGETFQTGLSRMRLMCEVASDLDGRGDPP